MTRFFRNGWEFGTFTPAIAVPVAITLAATLAYVVVYGIAVISMLVASDPLIFGPIAGVNLLLLIGLIWSWVRHGSEANSAGEDADG